MSCSPAVKYGRLLQRCSKSDVEPTSSSGTHSRMPRLGSRSSSKTAHRENLTPLSEVQPWSFRTIVLWIIAQLSSIGVFGFRLFHRLRGSQFFGETSIQSIPRDLGCQALKFRTGDLWVITQLSKIGFYFLLTFAPFFVCPILSG